jgi:hypothetical protein
MSRTGFKPGDNVLTPKERGIVVDVRATPSGKWVYGVEDASGAVNYFTENVLTHASS